MSSRPVGFIDTHKIGIDINFQNMIKGKSLTIYLSKDWVSSRWNRKPNSKMGAKFR